MQNETLERLAVGESDARVMLGGISRTTLYRIEKAGALRAVPNLGRKLYPIEELKRFLREGCPIAKES